MDIKNGKTKAVGVRIPEDLIQQVKVSAQRTKRSFNQWVVKAIKEKLNK